MHRLSLMPSHDMDANSMNLEDFKRWKVPELRSFLAKRGLKTASKKDELCALAYAAYKEGRPVVETMGQKDLARVEDYDSLLSFQCDGQTLTVPDPVNIKTGWIAEKDGVSEWPPTMDLDIAEYLLGNFQTVPLTKRLLSDYKEGKAYSYFDSKWLDQVFYHPIEDSSPVCLLKSRSVPSQRIHDIPHKIWIAFEKKTGTVKSSYCTCFAGSGLELGSTCNHVAAVLFKVDWAWKSGITNKACTSKPCSWNEFGAKGKKLDLQPVAELEWRKPNYRKGSDKSAINNPARRNFQPVQGEAPSIETLTNTFFGSCSSGSIFTYVDLPSQQIPPEADINVIQEVEVESQDVPLPVSTLIRDGCTSWEYSDSQVAALELLTRGQNTNSDWHDHRIGRITASNTHSVLTKVRHMEKCAPKRLDCSVLLNKLCTKGKQELDHVAAIKYGRAMEVVARQQYICKQHGHNHQLQVTECGLFVVPEKIYIAASPDAVVNCASCGEGLLEIKCPLSLAHTDPNAQPPPYIKTENGMYHLKQEHPYYTQVITQMGVTGRKWCDFFVYSPHGSLTVRVPFNDGFWKSVVKACDVFFFKHMIACLQSC